VLASSTVQEQELQQALQERSRQQAQRATATATNQ
jgi:hypothetical protein